jgi:hypothetical protein
MNATLPFPVEPPYRVDQVMAAPLAMLALFLGQLLLAALISRFALRGQRQAWWIAAGTLVASEALFFTLASWGTRDPTVLSHHLAISLELVRGEPFWMALAPLIVRLPWRMSLVHGLVVGGYAALAILLARHWRCPAWGGWWALLLCSSPMLRYFLQNGVSRQALLTLLLVPLLLRAADLARPPTWLVTASSLLAATVHSAFLGTLALVVLPRPLITPLQSVRRALLGALRGRRLLLVALGVLLVAVVAAPLIQAKLAVYLFSVQYFNSFPVAPAVQHLQLAMALGVVLTCWTRRLRPLALLHCSRTRVLLLFALLYGLLQQLIAAEWLPQIAIRFADPVGLFLLISWLAWLQHHRCLWAVLPALLVTLQSWMVDRLIASHTLPCGRNDEFLCVPDRWPWQLRY